MNKKRTTTTEETEEVLEIGLIFKVDAAITQYLAEKIARKVAS